MECICCRCGVLPDNAISSICINMDTDREANKHCFCCAKPPRMKCINCNAWRDLGASEAHNSCLDNLLHIFVYSEPWPPFSDHVPAPPKRVVSSVSPEPSDNSSLLTEVRNYKEFIPSPPYEPSIEIDSDCSEVDVKPKRVPNSSWVTTNEINKWPHCIRCGIVRMQKSGWIRHARACGQNPKYNTKMFFIRLHTLAWCGQLVQDCFWNRHTDPDNGTCKKCRDSRKANQPLPYMPKPPPRPNEHLLEKNRRKKRLMTKQRRKTLAEETILQSTI